MSENENALSSEQDAPAPEAAIENSEPAQEAAKPEEETPQAEQGEKPGDEASVVEAEGEKEPEKVKVEDEEAKRKRKRKNTYQERIDQLTHKVRDAERRADANARRLAELQAKETPPNPNDEKYLIDQDAYQADLTAHRLRSLRQEDVSADVNAAQEEAAVARVEAFQARVESFRDEVPDFDQVAFGNHVTITPSMAELIAESEMGPQVAYALGKNTAEARNIASMSRTQQAIAIGRLEGRLEAQTKAPRRVTQAPEPIAPAAGRKSPTKLKYSENMSHDDYAKWKKQEGWA